MFNLKKPVILKKKQKRRINKTFNIFYNKSNGINLLVCRGVNLLYYNLTFLNFILNKKKVKKKKMSRKEKFKRGAASSKLITLKINKTALSKFGNKNIFNYLTSNERKNIKVHFLKKPAVFKKRVIIVNLPLAPYTKKTVGLRMGKGKGPVKNFQFKLRAGLNLISFKN
jgi:ribosomal protein L16/L10AE